MDSRPGWGIWSQMEKGISPWLRWHSEVRTSASAALPTAGLWRSSRVLGQPLLGHVCPPSGCLHQAVSPALLAENLWWYNQSSSKSWQLPQALLVPHFPALTQGFFLLPATSYMFPRRFLLSSGWETLVGSLVHPQFQDAWMQVHLLLRWLGVGWMTEMAGKMGGIKQLFLASLLNWKLWGLIF